MGENKLTRLFDDFLSDVGLARTHGGPKFRGLGKSNNNWTPAIDIKEYDKEYVVIVDVPGVRKEDIDIDFQNSVLSISGQNTNDPSTTTTAQEINVGHDNQSTEPQYQDRKFQQSSQPQGHPQQSQQQPIPQQSQQQPIPQQSQQQPIPQQSQQQTYPQQSQDYQQQSSHPQQSQDNQQQSQEYYHHKNKFQGSNDKFHVQERPYGQFSRSIQLPNNIMADDEFHASLENGILRIRIPKNNEKPKKKITIS